MDEPTGKRCTKCGEVKPLEAFGIERRRGRKARCLGCMQADSRTRRKAYPEAKLAADRRWRAANPEAARRGSRERVGRRRELDRAAVFDHYGHECACCGTAERLSIDHVNGDGKRHRVEIRVDSGSGTYRWLVVNGFPADFQVLCLPCNASKGDGGRCRLDHRAP